jgi:hypothetical protein
VTTLAARGLTDAQIARITAYVDRRFPAPATTGVAGLLARERVVTRLASSDPRDAVSLGVQRLLSAVTAASAAVLASAIETPLHEHDAGGGLALLVAPDGNGAIAASAVTLATTGAGGVRLLVTIGGGTTRERVTAAASAARLAVPDVTARIAAARDPDAVIAAIRQAER